MLKFSRAFSPVRKRSVSYTHLGNQLYEISDFGKMTGTQSFEVDITGCQVLEIETTGDSGSAIYLVDEQLK